MAVTGTQVLFSDNFSKSGSLNGANWDYNHAYYGNDAGNPAFLGNTLQRQVLPSAENGMARLKLDTWNSDWKDGKSFYGSEAISKGAWDAKSTGGLAFEATMKFEGAQGGMIGGMFFYQQFPPPPSPRVPHNELDWEILTSQLRPSSVNKISTNVFPHEASGSGEQDHPISYPVTQIPGFSPNDFHTYRVEWLPNKVTWLIDKKVIRVETVNVPQASVKQQLHLNLWGVPSNWGPSPGDPHGPNIGDPTFVPATSAGANKSYYLDVTSVKVEKLSTRLGASGSDALVGSALNDAIDGGGGNDTLNGGAGDDTIWGGKGDDVITGGEGDDTIYGDGGNDSFSIAHAGRQKIYGGDGKDVFSVASGLTKVDRLGGGAGSDTLVLGQDMASGFDFSAETITGIETIQLLAGHSYMLDMNDGNVAAGETLKVDGHLLSVADFLKFNGSAELDGRFDLIGGAGNDVLRGGAQSDKLTGGLGVDRLFGGLGNDRFVYGDAAESTVAGADWIRDWNAGDRVDLSAIDADVGTAGDQALIYIGASAFSGAPGELRVTDNGSNTFISADLDGNGSADFSVKLIGVHSLGSGSFVP
ncbi:hypothetical protein BH10PSE6_BH10PSE6_24720 [soil metagenome]